MNQDATRKKWVLRVNFSVIILYLNYTKLSLLLVWQTLRVSHETSILNSAKQNLLIHLMSFWV